MSRSTLKAQRRRSVVLVVAVLAVATGALLAGILLGPSVRSPAQAAADAAPPAPSLVTVAAERRVLAESVVVRGTVAAGQSVKVMAPAGLAGPSAVVTGVSGKRGRPAREGAVLMEVAGAPLYGLVLPFPLYRDIQAGARGPDVKAVQRALRRLGYRTPVSGVFDAGTQDGLRRFYRARGYDVPSAASTDDPAKAPADGQSKPDPAKPDPAKSDPRADTAGGTTAPMLPRAHVVRLDRSDRIISAVPLGVGAVVTAPETVVLELDAGAATVQASLGQEQRALVDVGSTAEIVDEVKGTRSAATVRHIADEPTQTDQGSGFAVQLAFTGKAMTPVKGHSVLVTIGASGKASPVLAVPVTAVYSRPDGTTFVTVTGAGGRTSDVAVSTGKSAGGWVEIKGEVEAGALVAVGLSGPDGKGS
jgi:peptidoglycan hydrolase-like protein with peptidoglycan-binding domain